MRGQQSSSLAWHLRSTLGASLMLCIHLSSFFFLHSQKCRSPSVSSTLCGLFKPAALKRAPLRCESQMPPVTPANPSSLSLDCTSWLWLFWAEVWIFNGKGVLEPSEEGGAGCHCDAHFWEYLSGMPALITIISLVSPHNVQGWICAFALCWQPVVNPYDSVCRCTFPLWECKFLCRSLLFASTPTDGMLEPF